MPQGQQDVLRVGIPPSMIGAEGDEPLVVEIPRNTPPDQVRDLALAQARATMPQTRSLGIKGGPDQSVGFTMPTGGGEDDVAQDILDAFPQLAGLLASFHPATRSSWKAAAGIPAGVEAVKQMIEAALSGKEIDPVGIGAQGGMGMLGKGVGDVITGVGNAGTGMVRRALGLSGAYKNRAAEEILPKLAISEKAKMTIPGVDAINAKATQVLPNGVKVTGKGMKALGDVMEQARLNAATSPNQGGGILSMITNLIDPPKQLAIGSSVAAPFGANTAETLAPVGEASFRALMAYLMSQLRGTDEAPPSGPRRRSQQ